MVEPAFFPSSAVGYTLTAYATPRAAMRNIESLMQNARR